MVDLLEISAPMSYWVPRYENPLVINNVVTIDWAGAALPVNRKAYSVNLYQAFNPATANAQAYRDAIDYLNSKDFRIHNLDMMKGSAERAHGWVVNPTLSTYAWDVTKITAALSNLAPGRSKMLAICRFPAAISDSAGKLIPGKEAEFAAFCVQLLQIAAQCNAGITSVQLLNELDTAYNGSMGTLGTIWNIVRDAIKTDFPTMQVGGHAFANVYGSANVDSYLSVSKSKMDFFAFNAYSTGNTATNPQALWNSAESSMRSAINYAKSKLQSQGVGSMPIYATEMGQFYLGGYTPLNVGAQRLIWEGLRLIKTANSNAAFIAAWNESDDWHGLVSSPSSGYQKRPAAHLYHLFNQHMLGLMLPLVVTGSTVTVPPSTAVPAISAMAVNNNGQRAIAIVNRSELPRVVRVQHNGWVPDESVILDVNLITGQGLQSTPIAYEDFAPGYAMPADSIALISIP